MRKVTIPPRYEVPAWMADQPGRYTPTISHPSGYAGPLAKEDPRYGVPSWMADQPGRYAPVVSHTSPYTRALAAKKLGVEGVTNILDKRPVSFLVNTGAAVIGGIAAFKFDGWWSTAAAVLSIVSTLRAFNDLSQMTK